jgi:hypothetical protein
MRTQFRQHDGVRICHLDFRMLHRGFVTSLSAITLIACHDEQRSTHVYASPPPSPKVAVTASPPAPELPLGAIGAGARLVSISDAATGAPVAIGSIADSVDVLTLVTFGPNSDAWRIGAQVELLVRGISRDTTLVFRLATPAPSIVAHAFRVAGLKVGRYTGTVRLRASGGRVIAESIPVYLEVVGP